MIPRPGESSKFKGSRVQRNLGPVPTVPARSGWIRGFQVKAVMVVPVTLGFDTNKIVPDNSAYSDPRQRTQGCLELTQRSHAIRRLSAKMPSREVPLGPPTRRSSFLGHLRKLFSAHRTDHWSIVFDPSGERVAGCPFGPFVFGCIRRRNILFRDANTHRRSGR